ncbi:MAG: LptA/OstA family protein [Myxococcota bacterium]
MAPSLLPPVLALLLAAPALGVAAEPTESASAPQQASPATKGAIVVPKPVGYRADSCRYLHGAKARSLACTGHVTIWREDLKLVCDKMNATFAPGGGLATATCVGAVKVVTDQATARSERAEFDGGKNEVQLTGKPEAKERGAALAGERIVINLGTGEIAVEKATGVVPAEMLGTPP